MVQSFLYRIANGTRRSVRRWFCQERTDGTMSESFCLVAVIDRWRANIYGFICQIPDCGRDRIFFFLGLRVGGLVGSNLPLRLF